MGSSALVLVLINRCLVYHHFSNPHDHPVVAIYLAQRRGGTVLQWNHGYMQASNQKFLLNVTLICLFSRLSGTYLGCYTLNDSNDRHNSHHIYLRSATIFIHGVSSTSNNSFYQPSPHILTNDLQPTFRQTIHSTVVDHTHGDEKTAQMELDLGGFGRSSG
ncbi:hypothetical protein OPQ81_000270 [Rhizoctonia solani]|nr:hypothetical protein OPQ81_000270 [Rhizoctonia solani]